MRGSNTIEMDRIFHALADSTRRGILRQVSKGEHSVSDIARPHDLTLAGVSKHLKVLEAASLIRRRKSGSYQMISLNPDALKPAAQWISFYEQFWNEQLGSLKNLLEKEEKR